MDEDSDDEDELGTSEVKNKGGNARFCRYGAVGPFVRPLRWKFVAKNWII